MDDTAAAQFDAIGLSAGIVCAFIANNSLRPSDLPTLIASVRAAVTSLADGDAAAESTAERHVEKATPAKIRK